MIEIIMLFVCSFIKILIDIDYQLTYTYIKQLIMIISIESGGRYDIR